MSDLALLKQSAVKGSIRNVLIDEFGNIAKTLAPKIIDAVVKLKTRKLTVLSKALDTTLPKLLETVDKGVAAAFAPDQQTVDYSKAMLDLLKYQMTIIQNDNTLSLSERNAQLDDLTIRYNEYQSQLEQYKDHDAGRKKSFIGSIVAGTSAVIGAAGIAAFVAHPKDLSSIIKTHQRTKATKHIFDGLFDTFKSIFSISHIFRNLFTK